MIWNLLGALALVAFFLGTIIYARAIRQLNATVDRLEALHIGGTLTRMEKAAAVVAANLAASVDRANATDGPEGAAADAALRTET